MSEISESLVVSIAQALNSAEIPCVLWGHCLLRVHGVPSIIGSIDYVIPDSHLLPSIEVLTQLDRLEQCSDAKACSASSVQRPTPPPAFHTHLKNSEVTMSLYLQSETLWFLPRLEQSLASPRNFILPSTFLFASDQTVLPPWRPGRGSGFFELGHSPVIVPQSYVLLEAFMLLYARDFGQRAGAFAMSMIGYIEEYVDDDGFLETEQLPEPLLTLYKELREGKTPVRQWTERLRDALGLLEASS